MAPTTTELHQLINDWQMDREEAHENACEALSAIEGLQCTATWLQLPLSVRQLLCASHAALGVLADGLSGEGP